MRVSEAALDTDFERALEKQHKLAQRMFDQTTMIPHIASQQHNRYELIDNDEKFQLKVAVPGIKDEDIDIKLEEGFITIQGHHEATTKNSRYSSKFEQTFSLDPAVDVKKFVATIDNGVLVVSAPKEQAKLAEKKVRKIPIMHGTKNKEELETGKEEIHVETVGAENEEVMDLDKEN
eukprot:CAMPEP_0168182396 /NCGR_PEP_ID=MMETSP0139_2-20121125/11872_1 /TAXON_ID=44445 /ORGANISM="Pseudo-nitzschia australis, Strain 10249 10 AB" /LENGTH=176 /DNA_ID=CAMNT_0008103325 /DNA_START=119 /DNA_END=649 /DNA_ORIENTATION=+